MNFETLQASLESMILYPMYYRRHGVRRPVQLVAPTLNDLKTLELPRASVLHYVPEDESEYGISQDEYILRNEPRIIMVDHVTELGDDKGPPRPTRLPVNPMIMQYHRKYRKTRRLLRPELALKDQRTLVVESYGLLPHLYRYTTTFYSAYYKWWNIQAAIWKRVGEVSAMTDRQQYMIAKLPAFLPSLAQLMKGENAVIPTRSILSAFAQPESLFLLEIWKWLGENREASVLSKASPEALAKMNLIFVESGKWIVVNLGSLNEWRKEPDVDKDKGLEPKILQRRFLRMLMFLLEARTTADADAGQTVAGQKTQASQTIAPPAVRNIEESADKSFNSVATPEESPTVIPVQKAEPVKVIVPATDSTQAKKISLKVNLDVDSFPDEHVEETADNIRLIDEAIQKDLEALDHVVSRFESEGDGEEPPSPTMVEEATPIMEYRPEKLTLEDALMAKVDALADNGMLSGAEYRRFVAVSKAYQKLNNPYGEGSLADELKIDPKDLTISDEPQIPDIDTVVDKTMLKSSLFEFDSKYIKNVLHKDILRSVVNLQNAGYAVTGYTVEETQDALNDYETHTVQLTPVQGKVSTVQFRIPRVKEDGTYRSNGVRYLMRKQRGDVPIRKLSPSKVALTSYYAKLFVTRSEKQVHNYPGWLCNQIAAIGMDPGNEQITHLMLSNVFDQSIKVPRIYSILSQRFRSFHTGGYNFFFDYRARYAQFGEEEVKKVERGNLVVIGQHHSKKTFVVVDKNDALYEVDGDTLIPIGTIQSLLGIQGRGPIEMAEIKIFNKLIPVGIFLAYHLGLSQLIKLLGENPRKVPSGERVNLSDDEFAIRFEDQTLVFPMTKRTTTLILSGFNVFDSSIRNYSSHLFDKKDIYFNILDHANIGVRYLREMDLMVDLFIDPITEEILEEMKEPTNFVALLMRACQLLETDWSPDETDMEYMRIKGYERLSGHVYAELVKAIRMQKARGSIANAKVELPPYAVWQAINNDSAVKLVEESNPIHNLKEKEEVTYSGTGGRSGRSMVRGTRVFHQNDMGVISEATKDSADVAITTFLTADPALKNVRGLTSRVDLNKAGSTNLLSTSAILAPTSDREDPKRTNFISIQQSQGTHAKGYRPSPLRTGYEQIIAHRTDDLFAYTAKQNGKVVSVTPKSIVVAYEDGSEVSVEIGRRFGTASGMTIPHEVVTELKVGDEFKRGDCIAYNTYYFQKDPLNKKQVLWKAGVLMTVALLESTDTLEDSCAISEEAAELLTTKVTKVRDIVVSFDQIIHNLVAVGTDVDVEDILCTIEDPAGGGGGLFDEGSLDTLRLLSSNNPRAKFKGKVEKIEVFYHGDIDDLSESLQELAVQSDKERRRFARDMKIPYTPGKVDDSMRIDGNALTFENAVIRVYITGDVGYGVGDKAVFGNQLKTITGRVMRGENKTESGEKIDATFGFTSIDARIVRSPVLIGTTNRLLKAISKRVAKTYFSG